MHKDNVWSTAYPKPDYAKAERNILERFPVVRSFGPVTPVICGKFVRGEIESIFDVASLSRFAFVAAQMCFSLLRLSDLGMHVYICACYLSKLTLMLCCRSCARSFQ